MIIRTAVTSARRVTASALAGTARVLGGVAGTIGHVAGFVRPGRAMARDSVQRLEQRGRVQPPPPATPDTAAEAIVPETLEEPATPDTAAKPADAGLAPPEPDTAARASATGAAAEPAVSDHAIAAQPTDVDRTAQAKPIGADRAAQAKPVAPDTEPDAPVSVRTSSSHVEALAKRPASEVVEAVRELSTDELRMLLEHEQAHRRRKTVIAAIESAAASHAS